MNGKLYCAGVAALAGFWLLPPVQQPVQAYPSTSPSARGAARLKYRPPANWIRHYLGDDRYKIAGKVWKVVSTQMDTYYHRPTCPNMLRQSPHIVIGFSGSPDATEAGYRPDHLCQPEQQVVTYSSTGTQTVTVVSNPGAAQRVTLSDGASSTLIPPGWQRLRALTTQGPNGPVTQDMFISSKARGSLIGIITLNAPAGVNLQQVLTPRGFRTMFQGQNNVFNSTGAVSNQIGDTANMINRLSVAPAAAGGLRGIVLRPRRGQSVPGLNGPLTVVGQGQKAYFIMDQSRGASGAATIIRSFRAR